MNLPVSSAVSETLTRNRYFILKMIQHPNVQRSLRRHGCNLTPVSWNFYVRRGQESYSKINRYWGELPHSFFLFKKRNLDDDQG
jgi:hypothetical protein